MYYLLWWQTASPHIVFFKCRKAHTQNQAVTSVCGTKLPLLFFEDNKSLVWAEDISKNVQSYKLFIYLYVLFIATGIFR